MANLTAVSRITDSWAAQEIERRQREIMGLQPELPMTNTEFIVSANLAYFAVTFMLYSFMQKQEKGFNLKRVIFWYNILCVCLAGAVVVGLARHWFVYGLPKFVCNEEDRSEKGRELAFVYWIFYAQKFIELLDTQFFILRKSFRQVSFLHVFHHSSIIVVVGSIIPHAFSGDMYLPILLNATVHVIMYGYYALTSLGYKFWWKSLLTTMQLIQFVLISTQSFVAWYSGPSCGTPDYAKAMMMGYMGSMIVLFGQFFVKSYLKKPKAKTA